MKNSLISLLILCLMVSACSPINSLQPFDQQQAEMVLKNDYVIRPAAQKIELSLLQQDWEDDHPDKNKRNLMLFPRGESATRWTQSVQTEVVAYLDEPKITAKKMALNKMKYAYDHCRRVNAMIIKQTTTFVTYKVDMMNCDNQPNQIQIGKTFNGIDAVYTVYYSALSNQVSSSQLQEMAQMIKTARLVHTET